LNRPISTATLINGGNLPLFKSFFPPIKKFLIIDSIDLLKNDQLNQRVLSFMAYGLQLKYGAKPYEALHLFEELKMMHS
jgi:hypothetical protein